MSANACAFNSNNIYLLQYIAHDEREYLLGVHLNIFQSVKNKIVIYAGFVKTK